MARNATWANPDGLSVGFGTHTVDNEIASVYQGSNGKVTVVLELTMASIPLASTGITYPNAGPASPHIIPRGSLFNDGFIQCLVVTTGASADVDLGAWSRGLATEVVDDANGFKDSVLLATLANVGDRLGFDGAYMPLDADDLGVTGNAGATSNSDVIFVPDATTVYTAGVCRVVFDYTPPTGSAGDSLAV